MDAPNLNGATVDVGNGQSPGAPSVHFLSNTALFATPYLYLIPVGDDYMRSPPLGDQSRLRRWAVQDVTIPLPFNIGASDQSSQALFQTADSL